MNVFEIRGKLYWKMYILYKCVYFNWLKLVNKCKFWLYFWKFVIRECVRRRNNMSLLLKYCSYWIFFFFFLGRVERIVMNCYGWYGIKLKMLWCLVLGWWRFFFGFIYLYFFVFEFCVVKVLDSIVDFGSSRYGDEIKFLGFVCIFVIYNFGVYNGVVFGENLDESISIVRLGKVVDEYFVGIVKYFVGFLMRRFVWVFVIFFVVFKMRFVVFVFLRLGEVYF